MKFFAVALGLCAIAAVSAVPAVVNTGHSAQFRSQDSLGNYAFGYNEDHATGGTFRRETGSPGVAQGSYGLRVADGRVRVVNYVADGLGFRANIQTNEPGVEDQDPASVLINKAAAIVAPYIKAPVAAPAPLAIQQSIEAPIVQKYEPAPIIEQAPIVQKYEAAPVIAQAPIVQKYEAAPIIEQAPIVQKYEPAPIIEQAPIVQKYEAGPAVISTAGPAIAPAYAQAYAAGYAAQGVAAPIVQKYEAAPIVEQAPIAAAPAVLSGYTTKTYAAPAPILSAPYAAAAATYATKTAAPVGIASSALYGAPIASPALAAKTLGGIGYGAGYGPLIKKK